MAMGGSTHRPPCLFIIIYSDIFKLIQIEMVETWSSGIQKFSNKIWVCRELNKGQISSLEFFKIQNGI
jgi:hypothetical protein